jgi:exopolysaccharide biosynthesis polyprenyl glycosylphosphotransferase
MAGLFTMRVPDRNIATAAFALRIVEAILTTTGICVVLLFLSDHQASLAASGAAFSIPITAVILTATYFIGLCGMGAPIDFRVALSRLALVTILIFLLAVATTGLLAKHDIAKIYPYRWQWTLALTAIWLCCVFAGRMLFRKLIERGYFARSIVAVTNEKDSAGLRRLTEMFPGRFAVAAHLVPATMSSFEVAVLSRQRLASEIVLSARDDANHSVETLPVKGRSGGRTPITNYGTFYERESGRVDLDDLQQGWLAQARGAQPHPFEAICRRSFDIAVALIAFIAAAPVMLLVALAIRIEDGEPILFRQTRVGLGGKEFTLFKFRSMYLNAEDGAVPVWAADNDPRITRVGRFIRKLRIDELPQFYNVLRGDMSFIGPRPERPYFVQQLSDCIPFYNDRHVVKPGITGWAQVSFHYGASLEDARHKTAYDLYYVKNRSMLLDLSIIARTVKVILWPQGVR